jgi:hypothetical protein
VPRAGERHQAGALALAHAVLGEQVPQVVEAVTIFGFGQPPGLGTVHQAGLSGGIFLDSPGDLDAHAVAFSRLRASALSAEESARLLCREAGR